MGTAQQDNAVKSNTCDNIEKARPAKPLEQGNY